MNRVFRNSLSVSALIVVFCLGLLLFYGRLAFYGQEWAAYPTNGHLYSDGRLVRAGMITDRNGEILAQTIDGKRVFHQEASIRKATAHAVGDLQGFVSTGAHTAFWQQLTGYDLLNGVYTFAGKGQDLQLTIDAQLSLIAYEALGDYAGTVGVVNYQTGELLCMVSTPTFDPSQVCDEGERGVYVNRLLSGSYAPGSVFKLVTALSVLEHRTDAPVLKHTCSRGVTLGGEWLSCLGNHGQLDLTQSLVRSCNAAFAQYGADVGREAMTETARRLGCDRSVTIDGISCRAGSFAMEQANDIDFGWSCIGQHQDMVNPFQYLTFMSAIAGNGTCVWPYLIRNLDNSISNETSPRDEELLDSAHAKTLSDMMRACVTEHYGEERFGGLELCAKTGTAEVGDQNPHSWFVGFCRNPRKPYAFVVVVEKAGAGLGEAATIAGKVLQAAPKAD